MALLGLVIPPTMCGNMDGQSKVEKDKPSVTESGGIFLLQSQDDLQLIFSVLKPFHKGITQISRQFHAQCRGEKAKTLLNNTINQRQNWSQNPAFIFSSTGLG